MNFAQDFTDVPNVRISNIPALVQTIAWCRPGAEPLSEPMMVDLLTHICVTWPHWVNSSFTMILKKTKRPVLLDLCEENTPMPGRFRAQRTNYEQSFPCPCAIVHFSLCIAIPHLSTIFYYTHIIRHWKHRNKGQFKQQAIILVW